MSRCTVNVRELVDNGGKMAFRLQDSFFRHFDNDEVQGGDVEVEIAATRSRQAGHDYELACRLSGWLLTPCTRCLDLMEHAVELADDIRIVVSDHGYGGEDDDTLAAGVDGTIDLARRLYETMALSIPATHHHAEGECNPAMEKWLGGSAGEE